MNKICRCDTITVPAPTQSVEKRVLWGHKLRWGALNVVRARRKSIGHGVVKDAFVCQKVQLRAWKTWQRFLDHISLEVLGIRRLGRKTKESSSFYYPILYLSRKLLKTWRKWWEEYASTNVGRNRAKLLFWTYAWINIQYEVSQISI